MKFGKYVAFAAMACAALNMAQAQDRTGWPEEMTLATAGEGGVYYVFGAGLADYITAELGVPTSPKATGGPAHNATLIQMGLNDIGLVTMGPMLEAVMGQSELANGVPHDSVRALFPMYETVFQGIALADSNITSLSDLAGKRVSVGPAGGTPGTYWPRILDALDISVTMSNTNATEAAEQLKAGSLDAFLFAGGLPNSTFTTLANEFGARPFSVSAQEQQKILSAFQELSGGIVPANTYVTQEADQATFGMWNFAVVNSAMPETLAYEITKLVMENNARMRQIHPASVDTLPQNHVHNTFLPFHTGAARWFAENAFSLPSQLTQ
jgi:uncharacterized protein